MTKTKTHQGRVEFDFFGISEKDLNLLHDELVETVERWHQDEGMHIKFWRSYQITLDD